MLALTRKKDEAIMIGDHIEIKILDVQGDKVRLGISAPKDVNIYREEIYTLVKESNQTANVVEEQAKESMLNLRNLVKQIKK